MVMPLALLLMGAAAKNKIDAGARAEEDRKTKLAREAEDRAYMVGQRERTLRDQADADTLRTGLADAYKPVTPQVEAMPGYVDNRDVGADWTPQIQVAGMPQPSMPAAQAAAAGMNTRPAQARRAASLHRQSRAGNATEADRLEEMATHFEKEGVTTFVERNLARLPDLATVKASPNGVDFSLDGVADYNGLGKDKIPDGARGRAVVRKLPNGQEIVDFGVVDAAGKPVPGSESARAVQALNALTVQQRLDRESKLYKEGQDIQTARDNAAENVRSNKAREAIEAEKAAGAAQRRDSQPPEDRMSDVDKAELASINQQMRDTNKAILDAQASGTADPNGMRALTVSLNALRMRADAINAKYREQPMGSPRADDPPPPSKMEQIQAAMARNGETDAVIRLAGMPEVTVGRGAAAPDRMFPAPMAGGVPQMGPNVAAYPYGSPEFEAQRLRQQAAAIEAELAARGTAVKPTTREQKSDIQMMRSR